MRRLVLPPAPPRLPGPLFLHPFEIAFGVLFVVIGASLLGSGLTLYVSEVQRLPTLLVGAWAFALILGGPAMILGVLRDSFLARGVERAGLYLAGSAWASYALTMAVLAHEPLAVMQGVAIAAACLLRAAALRKVDRVVDHVSTVADREE